MLKLWCNSGFFCHFRGCTLLFLSSILLNQNIVYNRKISIVWALGLVSLKSHLSLSLRGLEISEVNRNIFIRGYDFRFAFVNVIYERSCLQFPQHPHFLFVLVLLTFGTMIVLI